MRKTILARKVIRSKRSALELASCDKNLCKQEAIFYFHVDSVQVVRPETHSSLVSAWSRIRQFKLGYQLVHFGGNRTNISQKISQASIAHISNYLFSGVSRGIVVGCTCYLHLYLYVFSYLQLSFICMYCLYLHNFPAFVCVPAFYLFPAFACVPFIHTFSAFARVSCICKFTEFAYSFTIFQDLFVFPAFACAFSTYEHVYCICD